MVWDALSIQGNLAVSAVRNATNEVRRNSYCATKITLTVGTDFTILKGHASDSFGAMVSCKTPRQTSTTQSGAEPMNAWSTTVVFLKVLAVAMCGATLVAAWRDGGAAKRTRL